MLLKNIFVVILCVLFVGCTSTKLKTYDKNGFPLNSSTNLKFKTKIKTGVIKTGHSDWISTADFSKGKDPEYYCSNKERHSWGGELWMFEYKNQKEVLSNLNSILKSNNIYDEKSQYELLVHFERIYQGERDEPVYTFDANVSIVKNNSVIYSKHHHLVGNDMSEEYWTTDSWAGAKKRATNRLLEQIIRDLNSQLGNIGT